MLTLGRCWTQVVGVALLGFAAWRWGAGGADLHAQLDLPPGPVRLVVYQPADCPSLRRAILHEVREDDAVPVALYADHLSDHDLSRSLGLSSTPVRIRRLDEGSLGRMLRGSGMRRTPFILTLRADGTVSTRPISPDPESAP